MGTVQRFTETWKESTEYEETAILLEQAQAVEDDSIVSVSLEVTTVQPDGTTKTESVTWNRQAEIVEE